MARAYAVAGDPAESQKYVKLAEQAGAQIEDDGNRKYFIGELGTIA